MGIVDKYTYKTIYIDSAPLIYYIEGNLEYIDTVSNIFERKDEIGCNLITSALTITELFVKPYQTSNTEIIRAYEKYLLSTDFIDIFDLDIETAKRAAEIRAEYNYRTPDSIHLATAVEQKADYFLTNDTHLKSFKGVSIVLVSEL